VLGLFFCVVQIAQTMRLNIQAGSAMALPSFYPNFTLHTLIYTFTSWDQATIFWFKLGKCGVFGSAFFFSTSWAEASGGESVN